VLFLFNIRCYIYISFGRIQCIAPLIMYKTALIALFIFCSSWAFGQERKASYFSKATSFNITEPLSELPVIEPLAKEHTPRIIPNKLRRNKNVNKNAKPIGPDPSWQKTPGRIHGRSPLIDWEGTNFAEGQAIPPDPSGAVGPDHYVHMVNTSWKIFDKTDSLLYGPASLGSIWGGSVNDGDPIVMYDKFADRWFLSEFEISTNSLMVAVSTSSDPLGSYYTYIFPLGNTLPDYPKYSVWNDGYYVTANKSGEQCYVLERDAMLVGDSTAQIIGFVMADIETSGFFSALPANAGSTLPEAGTPNYLFYFQDDGWSNQVDTDHVKIWEVDVNWTTPANSTISAPQSLDVAAFDSEFTAAWDDIEQPNGQFLDAIPGAFMYMAQYREFPGYEVVVLNHTVDVNATNHGGVRWYELRKYPEANWSVYQQGTYAPDSLHRWMASICMDYQGNIGLAYSVSGPATFPSLRYTGRHAGDPLGEMTIIEETIVNGTSSQSATNRYGDYAQMTIDPSDDATFWFTGEYISNNWKTRIAAFKIANDFDHDLAIVDINSPVNSIMDTAETITVSISNFGLFDEWDFEVGYQVDTGAIVSETYMDTILSGQTVLYSFSQHANLSIEGQTYSIKTYTGLATDEFTLNDTLVLPVMHLNANDIGITAITSPFSGNDLTDDELLTVHIENFGYQSQVNFPVSYGINGGAWITDTVMTTLDSGSVLSYSFTETADLSSLATFDIIAFTGLALDVVNSNDTLTKSVEHFICSPNSNCQIGDHIERVVLGTIDNSSMCSEDGYGDFSYLITDLQHMGFDNLQIKAGFINQRLSMWVDFNDNFSFETDELVISDAAFSNSLTSIPFNIPLDAPLGEHLCRIRSRFQQAILDPCVDVEYGETEDYTVNIITNDTIGLDENELNFEYQIMSLGNGLIQLDIQNYSMEILSIKVHNSIGQLIQEISEKHISGSFSRILDLSAFSDGYYLISIGDGNQSRVKKVLLY